MADVDADLFGEESDEDHAEQDRRARKSQSFQQPARRLGDDDELESDEDDQPQRNQRPIGPPLQLSAELVDLPARDSIRLVRLSNILGLDQQPYDPSTFQVSQEYYTDEQGTRRIKLTNQLRWREVTDAQGQAARQSNARFVQWEDGSWQLLLGEEVLDVKELDMQQDNSFLFVRHQGVIQVNCFFCLWSGGHITDYRCMTLILAERRNMAMSCLPLRLLAFVAGASCTRNQDCPAASQSQQ